MLSKCANPGCDTSFLYLHQGKLYRMETVVDGSEDLFGAESGAPNHRQLEFFWLCDDCASKMTLSFEKGVGVKVALFLTAKAA